MNKYQEVLDNIINWLHPEYQSTFRDEFDILQELVDTNNKIYDLMKKYNINDLTDLEIALDYYEHRYDKVETRRVDKKC